LEISEFDLNLSYRHFLYYCVPNNVDRFHITDSYQTFVTTYKTHINLSIAKVVQYSCSPQAKHPPQLSAKFVPSLEPVKSKRPLVILGEIKQVLLWGNNST
jgi:hypothetical protein